MTRFLQFLSLISILIFSCGRKAENGNTNLQPVVSERSEPLTLTDTRIYRLVEDQGRQGRDTFRLEGGRYTHINWNGIGQKWLMESQLIDTSTSGIWIMRTTGFDYNSTPIDTRDSFQVRKADEEVIISQWVGNRPNAGRHIQRLK